MWGYSGYAAISKGVVTPSKTSYVILFVTKEKQESLTQYDDDLHDGILRMDGEERHTSDVRLIKTAENKDEIHLFYRERHHLPFTYIGRAYLTDFELRSDLPSRFRFALDPQSAAADEAILTEERTHGGAESDYVPESEGRKRIRRHIAYERSRKNRARAIEIHGTSCKACGFDFNSVYGADHARDFIEVHHVRPISELSGDTVDPVVDLIPLCSNCHSMAHRDPGRILSVDEIWELLRGEGERRKVMR